MEEKKKHRPPNQLRNVRTEAGLRQSDIAFLLDIKNVGRISEWEQGTSNPSIEHLLGLSIIYQKLEAHLYYELRKHILRKIEERKKKLLEIKEQDRRNRLDAGG